MAVDSTARREECPFQIRGTSFTVLTLRLLDPFDVRLFSELRRAIAQAPDFYRDAPIVLDLAALGEGEPFGLKDFTARLREHGLVPVGVLSSHPYWDAKARAIGLGVLPAGRSQAEPPQPARLKKNHIPSIAALRHGGNAAERHGGNAAVATKVVTEPVRSGQQIIAPHGDLVVLANVAAGAEVMAEGHIHVYGPLRGRALAGMAGNLTARIFCQALYADLVSIGGVYLPGAQIESRYLGQAVSLHLAGEHLVIDLL